MERSFTRRHLLIASDVSRSIDYYFLINIYSIAIDFFNKLESIFIIISFFVYLENAHVFHFLILVFGALDGVVNGYGFIYFLILQEILMSALGFFPFLCLVLCISMYG